MFKVGDVVRYARPNNQRGGLKHGQVGTVVQVVGDLLIVDCNKYEYFQWRFEKVGSTFKGNIK